MDIFLFNLVIELPKNTCINTYAIELIKDKQLLYSLIYTLSLVELETLKTYIKTYLETEFIRSSKSPVNMFIFFDKKPNGSFRLCVDYWGLNNLTIKN